MNTPAVRIARMRKFRGLTQGQLATLAGLPYSQIRNLETKRFPPRFDTIVAIARALSISIDWIANGPDEDNPSIASAVAPATRGESRPVSWCSGLFVD